MFYISQLHNNLCNSSANESPTFVFSTLQVGGTAGAEWAHLKLPAENWGISHAQLTELATYRWWKWMDQGINSMVEVLLDDGKLIGFLNGFSGSRGVDLY